MQSRQGDVLSLASGVFDDLNVLDISTRLSAAFAARFFGDFGADVLLAEPPAGHCLRSEPPFFQSLLRINSDSGQTSPLHSYINRNKRSAAYVELADLQPLVEKADLVI